MSYRSGWCANGFHQGAQKHPVFGDSIQCRGEFAGTTCSCPCHTACPHCGQQMPKEA